MSDRQAYADRKAEIASEQADMSRDEVMELMKQRTDYQFDLDNIPTAGDHRWIDRGEVLSCEGAGHQSHRHFKRR